MKISFIISISDIDASVTSDRMRVDGLCRGDAVLPLLLHLSVHDQQRVMREVDGNLSLGVAMESCVSAVIIVFGDLGLCCQRKCSEGSDDSGMNFVTHLVCGHGTRVLRQATGTR